MKTYRVQFTSNGKRLIASVNADSPDTALNIARDVYPWGEGFEIID